MSYSPTVDAVFTHSERTVLKYTVGGALASAKRRLEQKRCRHAICTNAIGARQLSEKITLVELNRISDRIFDDTMYYRSDMPARKAAVRR